MHDPKAARAKELKQKHATLKAAGAGEFASADDWLAAIDEDWATTQADTATQDSDGNDAPGASHSKQSPATARHKSRKHRQPKERVQESQKPDMPDARKQKQPGSAAKQKRKKHGASHAGMLGAAKASKDGSARLKTNTRQKKMR